VAKAVGGLQRILGTTPPPNPATPDGETSKARQTPRHTPVPTTLSLDDGGDDDSDDGEEDGKDLTQRILDALAWWESADVAEPTKAQVAFVAKAKPGGGYFTRTIGTARTTGLISYPSPGKVSLTADGRAKASAPKEAPTYADLLKRARSILKGTAQKSIFDHLANVGEPITKASLGDATGLDVGGGYVTRTLGQMRTAGIINYPDRGMVELGPAFKAKI
jgi:hypothetical protein